MKKIETIIQPKSLVVISNALTSSGVMDMTVIPAMYNTYAEVGVMQGKRSL